MKIPSTEDRHFMGLDVTETSIILLCSWYRVQQCPAISPDSVIQLWRNLPLSSGIARIHIKTTPTRVSDFLSFHATETSLIRLHNQRRTQQPPAIRSRIGQTILENSAIKFWDCQSTNEDNSHNGQQLPEL